MLFSESFYCDHLRKDMQQVLQFVGSLLLLFFYYYLLLLVFVVLFSFHIFFSYSHRSCFLYTALSVRTFQRYTHYTHITRRIYRNQYDFKWFFFKEKKTDTQMNKMHTSMKMFRINEKQANEIRKKSNKI